MQRLQGTLVMAGSRSIFRKSGSRDARAEISEPSTSAMDGCILGEYKIRWAVKIWSVNFSTINKIRDRYRRMALMILLTTRVR